MARQHHHSFARQLQRLCLSNPDKMFAELRGPMREAFLMFLWTEAGRGGAQPLPHVDIGTRTKGGNPEVIALDVVGAEERFGVEIVVVQMPPAVEANESWFVAATRANGKVRAWGYERSAEGDAVLAEQLESGHANFGFFPDASLDGFLSALGGVLGVSLRGLAKPTGSPVDALRAARAAQAGAAVAKKAIWGLLLLAVLLLLPGLVTLSFAIGEATNFGNDWVAISYALLSAAGLCVTWALGRRLHWPGAVAGALVLAGGIGAATIVLQGKIADREEYRTNHDALMATQRFCEGHGQADARARAYDADGGTNPTLVFEDLSTGGFGSLQNSHAPEFDAWSPKPFGIQHAALVACVKTAERSVETCRFSEGATIDRMQVTVDVTLYSIASGDKIFSTQLQGAPPRECKWMEEFYGDGKKSTISGDRPPMDTVRKVLAPHVER